MQVSREKWSENNQSLLYKHYFEAFFNNSCLEHLNQLYIEELYQREYCDYYNCYCDVYHRRIADITPESTRFGGEYMDYWNNVNGFFNFKQ